MSKFEIHNIDVDVFAKELNNCKGQVWLTTDEGDRINLMSAFCRMIGLMSIIQGAKLSQATIECENPEDESRLFRLNLYGRAEKE
ncbi:MAG: hypothetical protein IJX50_01940 [Clostridia bacterium]|nr:hypothetical protein [Clostridia bacterium]